MLQGWLLKKKEAKLPYRFDFSLLTSGPFPRQLDFEDPHIPPHSYLHNQALISKCILLFLLLVGILSLVRLDSDGRPRKANKQTKVPYQH